MRIPRQRWACAFLLMIAGANCLSQITTTRPTWLPAEFEYTAPFFEHVEYDSTVATPRDLIGFELGSRPIRHAEVERCLQTWAQAGKLILTPYARTHENRALYYALVTSPRNRQRLDAIKANIGKLADPRTLTNDSDVDKLIAEMPAVAWMAYTIHGDELSGSDASIALLYHLIAAKDAETARILDDTVILIDPIQNPDGRDRWIAMIDQFTGHTPNLDTDALQHAGRWPWGRGNHYYFDMNRDWILGTQPETRGRQKAINAWQPQLMVDAHEMGPESSFLFYPTREPFNPHLPTGLITWWNLFAGDQARAFDQHGWSYYTREWAENWYPGYSDSWASYLGAVGILYEQARTAGRPVRVPSGNILTYRESVHHQLTSSWANLRTLQANRPAVMRDYIAHRRQACQTPADGAPRAFLIPPGTDQTRLASFVTTLTNQGIVVQRATQPFTARNLIGTLREAADERRFPAGTIVIPRAQPNGALAAAILEFDPRVEGAFLNSERRELETKRASRLYDVTGWSLPMAYGLPAFTAAELIDLQAEPATLVPPAGVLEGNQQAYGFVVSAGDESWAAAAAHLLQSGVITRAATKPFNFGGHQYPRGSLLIRRHENKPGLIEKLQSAAAASGATIRAVDTARSTDESPDLGADAFNLLRMPRVGLLSNSPIDPSSVGALWQLLDEHTQLEVSLLDSGGFGVDWRRYNVIILPETFGPGAETYGRLAEPLKSWVHAGGTLVAIGNAAEWLADEKLGLSAVRRRSDVLKKLDEYAAAIRIERKAGKGEVDGAKVWDEAAEVSPLDAPEEPPKSSFTPETLDEWRSIFSPSGVIARVELNPEHWLSYGCGEELPVFVQGNLALLSKHPVETPVRMAEARRLRLSGLLWPEAAARLADSAYATVEHVGNGQIVLFAQHPCFRGVWHGTQRLFLNAVLLGPGCGVSLPNP